MSVIIELAPVERTLSPKGVLHLISQNPEDYRTLCGVDVLNYGRTREGAWTVGVEAVSGPYATCLPCRLELVQRRANMLD